MPLVLVDTAGVRETEDPIEREGVHRSKQQIEEADLLLLLLDGSEPPPTSLHEWNLSEHEERYVVIRTKCDLPPHNEWPSDFRVDVELSCETGAGLDALLDQIRERFSLGEESVTEKALVTKPARRGAATNPYRSGRGSGGAPPQMPFEIVAGEMQLALEAIGEIVGATTPDDILNHIFSEFCIGK